MSRQMWQDAMWMSRHSPPRPERSTGRRRETAVAMSCHAELSLDRGEHFLDPPLRQENVLGAD